MTSAQYDLILAQADIPEHSVHFMQAMSGGLPFLVGSFLFLHAENWLLAVGYPITGVSDEHATREFDQALRDAQKMTRAEQCWAISPSLPERLGPHRRSQDQFFILTTDSPLPSRPTRLAQRAARILQVEESTRFTAAHRRLWAECTSRGPMPDHILELYARTESVITTCPGLSLLNAWDQNGHLAACLLLDSAPRSFLSYILGAHSRTHPTPYASDLLFLEMIHLARTRNKTYLHLGLGVNSGIRRFKEKWSAVPTLTYEMAQWRETGSLRRDVGDLMQALVSPSSRPMSKQEYWASLPPQRTFKMLWKIEKNGRTSWIGGTAHFFCYSFEHSLRRLFDQVDTVVFEGPLDKESLDQVAEIGRRPEPEAPRLITAMTEQEIRALDHSVCGPRGPWARLFGLADPNPLDVVEFLTNARHWMAFFSLWTHFLRRLDWNQSVDLEAWHLAHEMGKNVLALESIPEQIETLESIPLERIVRFFRACGHWKRYTRQNMKAYLKGDLDQMMGTSAEFPSRTDMVIGRRDAVFLERMLPMVEAGRCAVFVGSAHIFNLRDMLTDAGFRVEKVP
ncbi:TraB/GumN family protein [Desulfobulbus alkaliphilus]|uniref:TraB/GumN family protein n=1 Tax=Desulfobulbus alkaliphilus TaxID=869814 RepID=UPI0019667538|nr:TraB/GumN family protein [Desulfobulbus alkaliphilus]MBM9535608.1 TraB/GumN family protein [Desulfobulbus alkaliphilus]